MPISDIGIFLHKNSNSMLDVGTACPFDVRLQKATKSDAIQVLGRSLYS